MSGASSFPSFRSGPRPSVPEKAVYLTQGKEQKLENADANTFQEAGNAIKLFYNDRAGDFDIAKYDFCLNRSQVPLHSYCSQYRMVLGCSPVEKVEVLPTGELTVIKATSRDNCQPGPRYFDLLTSEAVKFGSKAGRESTVYGDYVPLTESEEENDSSMGLMPGEAVEGCPGVLTNPHDAQQWLELVDSAYLDTRFPQQARRQRAIAISSAALKENPESEPLIIKFMDLQGEAQSPEITLRLWQLVLKKFPHNWLLRVSFLDYYSSKCFSIYSVQQSLKHHIRLLKDILAVGEVGGGFFERIQFRLIALLSSSGHVEELVLLLYFMIWKSSSPTLADQDPTGFASYWGEKKAKYAELSNFPPNEECGSLLEAELRANFSIEDLEAELTVLGSALKLGTNEPFIRYILSNLGLTFAEGCLDMQHGYWTLSQDFSVSAAISLSRAPLLTLCQVLLLLTDLGLSSLLKYAEVLAAQLLYENHEAERALQLLKSCLSQNQSDMILWYHYTMLMRMTGSPVDRTISVLDKLISSPNFASSPRHIQSLLTCDYCEVLCRSQRMQEARSLLLKVFDISSLTPSSWLKIKRIIAVDSDPKLSRRWSFLLSYLCDQSTELLNDPVSSTYSGASAQSMAALHPIYNASDKQEAQVLLMALVQSAPYSKGNPCVSGLLSPIRLSSHDSSSLSLDASKDMDRRGRHSRSMPNP